MYRFYSLLLFSLFVSAAAIAAQTPTPTPSPSPTPPHDHSKMNHGDQEMTMPMPNDEKDHSKHTMSMMRSTTNLADPMQREASGTSWLPDSSPMYARMKMYKDGGMFMAMGTAFLRYTSVGSKRDLSVDGRGGRSRADAPNMLMLMYSRPAGKRGQIAFRSMLSLDPITQRGWGYPLLYQSGELYHGLPIHDRQHPHDLVSELSVAYSYKLDEKRSFYFYAGLPGEPALGPPTFMHRISGMNDPDAPISHHWQDATHITHGVVTAGFSFGKVKFEASAFNGTEPDENRWIWDRPRLNSSSFRISLNPTKNLSMQASYGYLRNPERSEPEIRILRKATASAIYNRSFGEEKNWATTFAWGQNYVNGERTNSYLIESNYDFYKNSIFGRLERVQKSGHELVLDHPFDHDVYWVGAASVGYIRDILQGKGLDVGLGGKVTINNNPSSLTTIYGGTTHGGWQVFVRLRPSKMKH